MIGLIVNGLSKAVGGYFEHSAKKAKANSDLKIAEIDAKTAVQKKVAEGKVEWETAMAKASEDSWKDEAWTVCFIAIIIFWSNMASIAASFGLKSIGKFTK